jgi:hypothetical protein
MNVDFIILLLILLAFFGGLFWFVKQFPIYFIKYRAKAFGLELSKEEASFVQKGFCLQKDFLKGAKSILDLKPIPIEKLVIHYLAGGNLQNISNGIIEWQKRQKEVNFNDLSAVDLMGKDLKYEIENSGFENSIEVNGLTNGKLIIDYKANFKYNFLYSVWVENPSENLTPTIKDKLNTFLRTWEETDEFKTESFIGQNILPINFWERELGGALANQDIKVKKL